MGWINCEQQLPDRVGYYSVYIRLFSSGSVTEAFYHPESGFHSLYINDKELEDQIKYKFWRDKHPAPIKYQNR